jgi:type IV secretion system protein VirB11
VTELVINEPGWIGVETRKGWEWHEALPRSRLVDPCQTDRWPHQTGHHDRVPHLLLGPPGGERAQVVIPPAVERGFVSITIRKASGVTMDIDDFDRAGLFSEVRAHGASEEVDGALLPTAMPATGKPSSASPLKRKNILISGATGSGKTSFSKGLIKLIPDYERILTIEDTRELVVPQRNHVHDVCQGRQELAEGRGQGAAGSALRMRPDRILLQELRDGTAFFYLRNVNSGHPGSITTVHANTPRARSNSSPPRQGIRGRQRSRPP